MKQPAIFDALSRFIGYAAFTLSVSLFLSACGGGGGGAGVSFDAAGHGQAQITPPVQPAQSNTNEYRQEISYKTSITIRRINAPINAQTDGRQAGLLNFNAAPVVPQQEITIAASTAFTMSISEDSMSISELTLQGRVPSVFFSGVENVTVEVVGDGIVNTVTLSRNNNVVSLPQSVDIKIDPVAETLLDASNIPDGWLVRTVTLSVTQTITSQITNTITNTALENYYTTTTVDKTVNVTVDKTVNTRVVGKLRSIVEQTLTTSSTKDRNYEFALANSMMEFIVKSVYIVTTSMSAQNQQERNNHYVVEGQLNIPDAWHLINWHPLAIIELPAIQITAPKPITVKNVATTTVTNVIENVTVVVTNHKTITSTIKNTVNTTVEATVENIITNTVEIKQTLVVFNENQKVENIIVTQTITSASGGRDVYEVTLTDIKSGITHTISKKLRTRYYVVNGGSVTQTTYLLTPTLGTTLAASSSVGGRYTKTINGTLTISYDTYSRKILGGVTTFIEDAFSWNRWYNKVPGPRIFIEDYTPAAHSVVWRSGFVDKNVVTAHLTNIVHHARFVNYVPATLWVDNSGYNRALSVILPPPGWVAHRPYTEYDKSDEYKNNWGLGAINAVDAYDRSYFGWDVTVAVIDGGVEVSHPDLAPNIGKALVFNNGTLSVVSDRDASNLGISSYHGSAVAGIIAGVKDLVLIEQFVSPITERLTNDEGSYGRGYSRGIRLSLLVTSKFHGVAPMAKLIPVQLADRTINNRQTPSASDGIGYKWCAPHCNTPGYSLSHILKALKYTADNNVPIVNNSYGDYIEAATVRYVQSGSTITATMHIPISPSLLPIFSEKSQVFPSVFTAIEEITRDKDMVMVWSAGNGGFNQETGKIRARSNQNGDLTLITPEFIVSNAAIAKDGSTYTMSTLSLNANQVGVMGLAPLYEEGLLGKWVAVVATDRRNTIADFSNACGSAKHWCVAAPGVGITSAYGADGAAEYNGTSFAAAHVSGALAVLKSRFPGMPMNAVLAILFKTATDLGEEGVDDIYGHGLINLGKAITAQGLMTLAMPNAVSVAGSLKKIAGNSLPSQASFSSASGAFARQLSMMSVAVSYLNGEYYFDVPLSQVAEFSTSEGISIGNAAQDMFDRTQQVETDWGAVGLIDSNNGKIVRVGYNSDNWKLSYKICQDCEKSAWDFYGADSVDSIWFDPEAQKLAGNWSPNFGGLEFFTGGSLVDDQDGFSAVQYGVRKHLHYGDFSMMGEISEITERDSLLGNSGDLFGFAGSKSKQSRLNLTVNFSDWLISAGYMYGWTDSEVDNSGFISEASDITYSQWHLNGISKSTFQGGDELRFGVYAQPRIKGRVKIDYHNASQSKFIDELQLNLPTSISAKSLVLRDLSGNMVVWRLGYAWNPLPTHKNLRTAVGVEWYSGDQQNSEHAASFQLRWAF